MGNGKAKSLGELEGLEPPLSFPRDPGRDSGEKGRGPGEQGAQAGSLEAAGR